MRVRAASRQGLLTRNGWNQQADGRGHRSLFECRTEQKTGLHVFAAAQSAYSGGTRSAMRIEAGYGASSFDVWSLTIRQPSGNLRAIKVKTPWGWSCSRLNLQYPRIRAAFGHNKVILRSEKASWPIA